MLNQQQPAQVLRNPNQENLPQSIADEMHLWRDGGCVGNVPQSYVKFHYDLARDELERLMTTYKVLTIGEPVIRKAGHSDGMTLVQTDIMTLSGHAMRVQWSDAHLGFMLVTGHGQRLIYVNEIV